MADDFYSRLPSLNRLEEATDSALAALPDDWWLLATDVVGSTSHNAAGQYKNVNMVSAACITACLNALQGREIPFFFGGDGALLACPDADGPLLARVLLGMKQLARGAFGFELRVGAYHAGALRSGGQPVQVARLQATPELSQAIFRGKGVLEVDRRLKQGDEGLAAGLAPSEPNLGGLNCQWNEIPSIHGEMLTLLVLPVDDSIVFDVLNHVRNICGPEAERHPLNPGTMRLAMRPSKHTASLALSHPRLPVWQRNLLALANALKMTIAEYFIRRRQVVLNGVDWGFYFKSFQRYSDSEKLCGTLSMVVACTREQLGEVLGLLDGMEAKGLLVYGHHESKAAMLTCMVFDSRFRHYHFVDGAGGGYTLAARELKEKMAAAA